MKTIILQVTDQKAREMEYYLRKLYNAHGNTNLETLVMVAASRAVFKQAQIEADMAKALVDNVS